MPTRTQLIYYRGDDKIYELSVTNSAGAPVVITNAKLWFTIKTAETDTDAAALLQKKSLNAGGADAQAKVTNGPGGIARFYIKPADLAAIPQGTYFHDFQLRLAASDLVKTAVYGPYIIVGDITKTVV